MRVIPRRFFNSGGSHQLPGCHCRNHLNRPQEGSWNGPGVATPEDVESVYQFSLEWMKQVLEDPTKANLVVHCFAGVSRSSAMALIPLLLYYSSFRLAAERLFEVNKYAVPNTHVLYLITQKFGLDPGKVFEDLFRASQGGVGGNVRRR